MTTSLDINQIKTLIPHRYPMLLVDRMEDIVPFEKAVGIKNVSVNEPHFNGHFPDFPIMPGVLIVEAMAQTAGALVIHSLRQDASDTEEKQVFFMSIEEARFRKPVLPGHTLRMSVQKVQNRRTVWKFKGEAYVNDQLHAEAIFTAMIAQKA
ncbi:MAG: 3-hydroxyacyl-ACP dehydratase FabZ [Alphaproteobacteria bacterium]|jgi:3-hydroxyacyl-[acyl-carrier-protein] dehydratase|nr:3-hydroxyacyl-ACP dehydratase FabZ [Alphaproteobacteria bacterium]